MKLKMTAFFNTLIEFDSKVKCKHSQTQKSIETRTNDSRKNMQQMP